MKGGFQQMMKQFKDMQKKLEKFQEELVNIQAEASAGGGMVTAVVNGQKRVVSLKIDPEVVDPEDIEMLQDLIVAAVNEAIRLVEEKTQEQVSGLLPAHLLNNLPPLF